MGFRRILIAVDGSPIAAHAADVGFDLARSLGADVAIIYVVDKSEAFAPDSGLAAADLMMRAEQDGRRILAESSGRAHLQSLPTEFLTVGKPTAEVTRVAREWAAEMIVIGSHGRAGVTRLLLGSVAEAVVRHAPCPVLVVRPAS
jgi:nucleotide-binding universal stress UspA family protein